MVKRMLFLAVLLVPLVALDAIAQGLAFEVSGVRGGGDQKISYMPGMVRVESRDGNKVTIIRVNDEMVYTLNPSEKTYRQMTFEQMAMLTKGYHRDAAERERQTGGANRENDEQKGAESQKSQMGASNLKVTQTDELRQISGFEASKYTITKANGETSTLWVTKGIPAYASVKSDLDKIASRLAGLPAAQGILEVAGQVDGFPLRHERKGGVLEVKNISQVDVPAQSFEIPQGFTQEKGRGHKQGQSRDRSQEEKSQDKIR